MELNEVETATRKVKGVLSCHILVAEQSVSGGHKILKDVVHMLEHEFKISHSTIQIEVEDCGGHDNTTLTKYEHEHS